eukprot:CAMPEP_0194484236 /NCGR_PEP_ID=MMETSP0253-20130528/5608_1 /TAXON_ID=2966 /ORGANISM="Noctiluca scintillans" /LENGTH=237 /DNA_ID=CAMNT_0039324005 /DNA_START=100 /DNA_END=810 /DNA_ORIENTATION=+
MSFYLMAASELFDKSWFLIVLLAWKWDKHVVFWASACALVFHCFLVFCCGEDVADASDLVVLWCGIPVFASHACMDAIAWFQAVAKSADVPCEESSIIDGELGPAAEYLSASKVEKTYEICWNWEIFVKTLMTVSIAGCGDRANFLMKSLPLMAAGERSAAVESTARVVLDLRSVPAFVGSSCAFILLAWFGVVVSMIVKDTIKPSSVLFSSMCCFAAFAASAVMSALMNSHVLFVT